MHGADKIAALRGEWEVETCQAISPESWDKATEFSDPLLDDLDGFLAGVARAQKNKANKSGGAPRFGKENGGGFDGFGVGDLATDALFSFPAEQPSSAPIPSTYTLSESDLDDW